MFFNNLGNDGAGTGVNCYPSCFTNTSFIDGTTGLTVYLTNTNNNWYWLLEADDADPVNYKKAFSTGDGIQDVDHITTQDFVWPLLDGDVGLDANNNGIPDLLENETQYPLYPRLDGAAYYDPQTNLTWSTNANISTDSLNVNGMTGWRLPHVNQNDPTCLDITEIWYYELIGVYSTGHYCTGSDLGKLFYNTLGGAAGVSIADTHNSNFNLFNNVMLDYGYQTDLLVYYYLAGQEHSVFNFSSGVTGFELSNIPPYPALYTWPVHTGDVHLSDSDGDGVAYINDNCPAISNIDQTDSNNDGVGDLCASDVEMTALTILWIIAQMCQTWIKLISITME